MAVATCRACFSAVFALDSLGSLSDVHLLPLAPLSGTTWLLVRIWKHRQDWSGQFLMPCSCSSWLFQHQCYPFLSISVNHFASLKLQMSISCLCSCIQLPPLVYRVSFGLGWVALKSARIQGTPRWWLYLMWSCFLDPLSQRFLLF